MASLAVRSLAGALALACSVSLAQPAAPTAVDCAVAAREAAAGRAGARSLYGQGCFREAQERIQSLLDQSPAELLTRARLHNDAAVIGEALGDYAQARKHYNASLGLLQGSNDKGLEASVLGNLAALEYRVANYGAAASAYQQALATLENTPEANPAALSASLSGLGLVEQTLGQYQKALAHLARALALDEKRLGPVHRDVATDLSNLGDLHRSLGNFNLALPMYQRSLKIRQAVLPPDHMDIGTSLTKIAYALQNLGARQEALGMYRQVLQMRERSLPATHPYLAVAQSSLADALRETGQFDEARHWYTRALDVQRKAYPGGHSETAATLHEWGRMELQQGQYALAIAKFREALVIRENVIGAMHSRTADTMSRLGGALADSVGHAPGALSDEALALLVKAFAIARVAGVPEVEFSVGTLLATHFRKAGQPAASVFIGKRAINAMQAIRTQSRSLDAALQKSLLFENSGTYRDLAASLVDLGRLAEAEQVLAMLKEFELADLIQRRDIQKTQADMVGPEKAAERAGDALSAGRVAESTALANLQQRQRAGEKLDEQDSHLLKALRQKQVQWQSDFEQWVSKLPGLLGKVVMTSGDALNRGTEMQTLVRGDRGAVGLSYIVGEKKLAIVVVTGRGSFGREVAISRVELNRLVSSFRQAISDRRPLQAEAEALYRWLIAPVQADLEAARADKLVLSLTDNLRYLPFAALHDGQRYLVERFAIAHWLQASGTPSGGSNNAWQVAGLGAASGATGFSPLPAVSTELNSIVKSPERPQGILPGQVSIDAAFDRAAFDEALSGRFSVVHIASHFDFKPGDSNGSVLLLGNGETMSLRELAALDYLPVQLLTLSACNTASGGGINENGAEVEGLAAAVRRQGARSVLASLWPVADNSTAALMQGFYLSRGKGRAMALRDAQMRLIQSSKSGNDASRAASLNFGGQTVPSRVGTGQAGPISEWNHPFFWAAFMLSGDWQ